MTKREEELNNAIEKFLAMHRSYIDVDVKDALDDIVELAKTVGAQQEDQAMLRIWETGPCGK
jgi:hypothetical protein